MHLSSGLRILTIGDGDLSFSQALHQHYQPKSLCATVFDSIDTIEAKYGLTNYQQLKANDIAILCGFDVTASETWQGLTTSSFDVVIFQFPLIPNDASEEHYQRAKQLGDANLRNRRLLYLYLKHAQQYFLDPNGERLAIITSKDVKPYRQWDIEQSLNIGSTMTYLGQSAFDSSDFPNYKIRNVDRDKFVKQTSGISYYYSDKEHAPLASQLHMPDYLEQSEQYCAMCRVGPMQSSADIKAHQHSKRHRQMSDFDQRWRKYLYQLHKLNDHFSCAK